MSAHFTLAEITASDYAIRHGISNTPTDAATLTNIAILCEGLERVRAILVAPIHVSSGYRNPVVNAGIGGAKDSAHLRGLAADIVVPGLTSLQVARLIRANRRSVAYDQLIEEGGRWVHVAFAAPNHSPRLSELTATFPGPVYTEGIA